MHQENSSLVIGSSNNNELNYLGESCKVEKIIFVHAKFMLQFRYQFCPQWHTLYAVADKNDC